MVGLRPQKVIKLVPHPKLWVVSKVFSWHFFSLEPTTGKKLGQAFFHEYNILGVIGRFRPLGPLKRKFCPFLPKIAFFGKNNSF